MKPLIFLCKAAQLTCNIVVAFVMGRSIWLFEQTRPHAFPDQSQVSHWVSKASQLQVEQFINGTIRSDIGSLDIMKIITTTALIGSLLNIMLIAGEFFIKRFGAKREGEIFEA